MAPQRKCQLHCQRGSPPPSYETLSVTLLADAPVLSKNSGCLTRKAMCKFTWAERILKDSNTNYSIPKLNSYLINKLLTKYLLNS